MLPSPASRKPRPVMSREKQNWRVELGPRHWERHTHSGIEEQGFRLLGRISRAGQFGALGQALDGAYVQINGDHVVPLNRSKVEHALKVAQRREESVGRALERRAPSVAPTVTIKRRRAIAPVDDSAPKDDTGGRPRF